MNRLLSVDRDGLWLQMTNIHVPSNGSEPMSKVFRISLAEFGKIRDAVEKNIWPLTIQREDDQR